MRLFSKDSNVEWLGFARLIEVIFKRFSSRMVRLGQVERGYFQKIFQNRMVRLGQVERDYFQKIFKLG